MEIEAGKVMPSQLTYSQIWHDIKVIDIDLKAKYAEVIGIGSDGTTPEIYLGATEHTLHADETKDNPTLLSFPEFNGYDIICANISKYDLRIVFAKMKEEE